MAGLTKAAQDNILGLMKGTNWPAGTGGWGLTAPATTYVGLFTTNPTTDATVSPTGTEATGNAYARVPVTSSSGWSAISTVGSTSQISNSGIITFPTPTSTGWGTIIGVGIWDASTTGNLLWWASITSQAIGGGVIASFAIGALVLSTD